jgi:transcriptional regulator with XRE-family HTH domain
LRTSLSLGERIKNLRKFLRISQTDLGARLGASAMAVSRWERGRGEPSGRSLLKLGILSRHDPDICWNFWNRAGLTTQDVIKVLPIATKRLRRTIPILRLAKAGTGKAHRKATEENLVAIPFLRVVATAGKEHGSSDHDLSHAPFDQVIAAPRVLAFRNVV